MTDVRRRLRIGLLGQFGIGNLGNEGSLDSMLRFLRSAVPDAKLLSICSDPEFVSRTHNVDAAPIRAPASGGAASRIWNSVLAGMPSRMGNVAHTLKICSGLDAIIIPGTGVLDDYSARPSGFPYELWRWCWGARIRGAKVAMVSIGAGPIRNRLSRFFLLNAARAATHRSYRDHASREFMRELGLDVSSDAVFPDLAFGLPVPEAPSRPAHAGPVVALGVMSYSGWQGGSQAVYETYLAKITDYACWLLSSGNRINLVVGSSSDVKAVEDVRAGLARRCGHLLDAVESRAANSLGEVMSQLAQADIAVVTRFHNLVCALMTGRPVISLGYAGKNAELQREFGLLEYSQDVETFDLEKLKAQTQDMLAHRADQSARIQGIAAEHASRFAVQARALLEWLRR